MLLLTLTSTLSHHWNGARTAEMEGAQLHAAFLLGS